MPPRSSTALPDRRHKAAGVGGHVRAAFIDDADQPDRNAYARQLQTVGPLAGIDHLANGIGKSSDLLHRIGHRRHALRIKLEPVEHGTGRTACLRSGIVGGVGGKNAGLVIAQGSGSGAQSLGFLRLRHQRQLALRDATGLCQSRDQDLRRLRGGSGHIHARRLTLTQACVTACAFAF